MNNPATATVSDDDLPTVSIETRYDRVADADYVEYLVTAAPLTYDLTVTLNVVTEYFNREYHYLAFADH